METELFLSIVQTIEQEESEMWDRFLHPLDYLEPEKPKPKPKKKPEEEYVQLSLF